METGFEYYAFISYAHEDMKAATFLQHSLEHFRYEQKLVTRENCPNDKKYLRPVFRDKTDLNVRKTCFSDDLKQVLQQSKYLIVLCSEYSATSKYVADEIKHFLETHNNDTSLVIPVLLSKSKDVETILPKLLRASEFLERNLPSIANEAGETSNKAYRENGIQQCIAYMLDVPFPVIARRYQKERSRTIKITLGWTIAIAVLLAISTLFAIQAKKNAETSAQYTKELANFEKSVFPRSLVYGFVDNFLIYVVKSNPEANIILVLPQKYSELEHFDKIENYKRFLLQKGFMFQEVEIMPSQGGQRARFAFQLQSIENISLKNTVFIDFVTTVTAFKGVIDYKKKTVFYENASNDKMTEDYSLQFEKQVRDYLEEVIEKQNLVFDEDQLIFVRTTEELNTQLNTMIIKQ